MTEVESRKAALHALGFWRELTIYCLLAILPVLVILLGLLISTWWAGLYLLACIAFVVGYATFRFSAFVGMSSRQWLAVVLLFLACYVPSYFYLLYRARKYHSEPPPPPPRPKADDDPDFHPKGTSVDLDWDVGRGT